MHSLRSFISSTQFMNTSRKMTKYNETITSARGGNRVSTVTRAIKGLSLEANHANNALIKYEGGTFIDLTQDDDTDLDQDDDTNLNQDEDANLTEDDEAEDIPEKYAEKKGNRLKYYGHPP